MTPVVQGSLFVFKSIFNLLNKSKISIPKPRCLRGKQKLRDDIASSHALQRVINVKKISK